MSAAERLIAAMYAAHGEQFAPATDWISYAGYFPELRAAMVGAFGARIPDHRKLGLWLTERNLKQFGELVLHGYKSAKRKAWLWRVVERAKLAPPPAPAPKPVPPAPVVEIVQAPPEPKPGDIFTTSDGQRWSIEQKIESDGRVTTKRVPLPPPKPLEPAKPLTRVEQMRADYRRHHEGATPGAGGFFNPGGVVSDNMSREGGGRFVRVTGRWPV